MDNIFAVEATDTVDVDVVAPVYTVVDFPAADSFVVVVVAA